MSVAGECMGCTWAEWTCMLLEDSYSSSSHPMHMLVGVSLKDSISIPAAARTSILEQILTLTSHTSNLDLRLLPPVLGVSSLVLSLPRSS